MQLDFLIVGAQKSGTTALDYYLRNHDQVEMANSKEVHFFDDESIYKKRDVDYTLYHKSFEGSSDVVIRGEATPIYMYWDMAPRRIWAYNPNIKIIAILRNPIKRAFSHWNMERDRGADSLSFMNAIKTEQDRCRKALPLQHRVYSYVDRGFYTEQLRRLWRFFPREQTLVLKFDDLRARPTETMSKVARFLNISDFTDIRYKDVHSRQYVTEMTESERAYLRDIFYFEIKQLETMLGWDCEGWLS